MSEKKLIDILDRIGFDYSKIKTNKPIIDSNCCIHCGSINTLFDTIDKHGKIIIACHHCGFKQNKRNLILFDISKKED